MANKSYTIDWVCGHTTKEYVWGRTGRDADSKAEWMGDRLACPECRRQEYRDKVKAQGLWAEVGYAIGDRPVEIALCGDTYPIKDQAKALGYHWSERQGQGLKSLLGGGKKTWVKYFAAADIEAAVAEVKELTEDIRLGISEAGAFIVAGANARLGHPGPEAAAQA